MERVWRTLTSALTLLLLVAACLLLPRAHEAAQFMAAADNPEKLADLMLAGRLDMPGATREIEAALSARDPELAQSFVELAEAQGIALDPALRRQVADAAAAQDSTLHTAGSFLEGFAIGQPDDVASLIGTVTGDLLVYGDLRDAVRETSHLARGEEADTLILGLACVGLAVTAGTYASLGAATPARIGLSVFKAVGKTGRLTAGLARAVMRPLARVVDTAALKSSLGPAALLQPAVAIRGVRAAVKLDRADGLVKLMGDAGRLQARAGTRAALDGMRLADSPKDVARLARLAAAKGGKTRAILKLAGRGAFALTLEAFSLASWLFWGLVNVLWIVLALKRMAERTAAGIIGRGKLQREKGRRALRAARPAAPVLAREPKPVRLPVAPGLRESGWGDFVPAAG